MRAILTSFGPTASAVASGRHTLTPEMSAAVAARHSRMDEGLDGILAKVAGMDQDTAVDNIFKMVDYGHRSIEDMIPISIHLEDISIWMAQYIWSLVQIGGGQESSTRYLKFDKSGLVDPDLLNIPKEDQPTWYAKQAECFDRYNRAVVQWQSLAGRFPKIMRLPEGADEKMVTRLKKNYGFDRARYHLPVTALTRMNLTTWGREWAEICRYLLSSPWVEAQKLGLLIVQEIKLVAPRLLKHAHYAVEYNNTVMLEFDYWQREAILAWKKNITKWESGNFEAKAGGFLDRHLPFIHHSDDRAATRDEHQARALNDMSTHSHRYAPIGRTLKMASVQYGWDAVAIAEIRDMNRHRPGEKEFVGVPQGFYGAEDQIPIGLDVEEERACLLDINKTSAQTARECLKELIGGNPNFIYKATLGVQFPFSHTNTMNKFIYELELRTGKGTHFRYRKHYNDLLEVLGSYWPEIRNTILAGTGEPE